MLQRICNYGRSRKTVLWAVAVAAAVIIVIVLAVLLPQPGPDGTAPTPTPSATATPAGNTTATATAIADGTATPDGTPEGTTTPGRTSTPGPTADGGTARGIFFTEAAYTATQDGDGCEKFYTTINITAPVDFFCGCQLRLTWDPALFRIDDSWVNSDSGARGRMYNGSAWLDSAQPLGNPTGDNPFGKWPCPQSRPKMGDGKQGCANFVVDFNNCIDKEGNCADMSVPPSGPAEGTLLTIRWTTSGPGCWGKTANTGTTDIMFIPTLLCGCSAAAEVYDMEDEYVQTWYNTSVTVK